MPTITTLLQHPALWRGREQHKQPVNSINSGFAVLDEQLHRGGWPLQGSTEILSDHYGIGELSLLLPALARLSEQKPVGWLSSPWVPYAPALIASGLPASRCLIIDTACGKNRLWAAEQMLKSGALAAVLTWFDRQPNDRDLRRLHLAAQQGQCWHIHFRPRQCLQHSSPASLRMVLAATDTHLLRIDIHKQPGGWSGQQVILPRPQQLLWQQQPSRQWPGERPLSHHRHHYRHTVATERARQIPAPATPAELPFLPTPPPVQ